LIRAAALLVAGVLLGGGAVYAVIGASGGSDSRSLADAVADFALGRDGPEDSGVVTAAESLAIYRAIAEETSPANLEAALESAAASAWSPARDVEIDGLLARLAELAPGDVPGLARALGLETRFLADAYVYLAAADPVAAIRELASIESRSQRLDVALALLAVVGDNSAGIERVSAGLADDDRERLRVQWIVARAEYDPYGAFREAQSLGPDLAGRALERIGTVWAAQDPLGAIAQADLLAESLKESYLASVFREWVRLDAYGYLSWLESVPSPHRQASVALQVLAGSHPELVMSIVDGLSDDIGGMVKTIALRAMAEADPDAAIARAERMPAGSERDALLVAIASALGGRDPDAALAWARTVNAPPQNMMNQIMVTIAQRHPERAVEFLDNPPPGVDQRLVMSIVTATMGRDPETAQVLADKLVARDSIQAANALQNLISHWTRQDPERALDWLLAHDAQVSATALSISATAIASADPIAAAGYLDRIPTEYRSAWIAQVAGPYGLFDPNGALAWVNGFQGENVYDQALHAVITASARIDARSAAQALSQASPAAQLAAAPHVASFFAREDPFAATRWAEGLSEERARASAIGAAVSEWSGADFVGARNYTLDLDRGEARDQALNALILRSARSGGSLDRGLLDAFGSDRATQETLASAIPMISRNDPEEARALLERITSAEMRRQIEQRIEALAGSAPGLF
jgi:hypothetical protein